MPAAEIIWNPMQAVMRGRKAIKMPNGCENRICGESLTKHKSSLYLILSLQQSIHSLIQEWGVDKDECWFASGWWWPPKLSSLSYLPLHLPPPTTTSLTLLSNYPFRALWLRYSTKAFKVEGRMHFSHCQLSSSFLNSPPIFKYFPLLSQLQ